MTELENIQIEINELSLDQVFSLLEQQDVDQLQLVLSSTLPWQIADILEAMPPSERKQLWALIPESLGSETLTFLHDEVRNALIIEMPAE